MPKWHQRRFEALPLNKGGEIGPVKVSLRGLGDLTGKESRKNDRVYFPG
jgi:hypothetical protein